jgi:hypothetical protein
MVGCDVRSGVGAKSLGFKPFFLIAPLHITNSATAAPQNQLHLATALAAKAAEKFARWAAG